MTPMRGKPSFLIFKWAQGIAYREILKLAYLALENTYRALQPVQNDRKGRFSLGDSILKVV